MEIAGMQKTSTLDFPGRIACVLFCAGCNYRCYYCHNAHICAHPPLIAESEVWALLKKRAGLLDGVVFSGGEPTLMRDLAWGVYGAKQLGYQIKLDTNGSRPEVLGGLLAHLDYVAMDFKAPFEMYPQICGASAAGVRESMALLAGGEAGYELRTTLVPELTRDILIQMAGELPRGARWALQLYRPCGDDERDIYTPAQVRALADELKAYAPGVFARAG